MNRLLRGNLADEEPTREEQWSPRQLGSADGGRHEPYEPVEWNPADMNDILREAALRRRSL
jgi:hypothetical protein